jgi:NADPH:quinone reductase
MALTALIEQTGGPEVIQWQNVDLPAPRPGEVRMRNTAIGLNFIDTYHRSGLYPLPLPIGLGVEAAGIVEAVGEGVKDFVPGDRVVTMGPKPGAYASERNIAASALFHIPDDISEEVAAAAMLKACTVEGLVERCGKVQAKWPVLVHAAAGGVGLILVQWLKHMGAVVIGTASTAEKCARATAAGADHMILSGSADVAKQVRDLTGGAGVRVTFDGVGADSWEASLDATGVRGLIISFGNASGPVTGVSLATLAAKGALFVTRYGVYNYYSDPLEREAGADYVFDMIRQGIISISIDQRYKLSEVAQAHRDLESRKTTGSTVLISC